MAYNPDTGHLLVVSRTTSPPTVAVIDAATGNHVGTLDVSGISGGTFVLNQIDVDDNGVIYGANLVSPSSGTSGFKVYRWASEGVAPTLAYSGEPAATARFGDDFAVRGSGVNTEIVAGSSNSSGTAPKTLAVLTTADGSTFTAQGLPVADAGVANGDLRLGISFGAGSTVYANQNNNLRYLSYDGGAATLNASYTLVSGGGTPGPQEFSPANDVLVALTFGAAHRVNLYDASLLAPGASINPDDFETLPTANANANGSGSVEFSLSGDTVYVLGSNNGIHAYSVVQAIPEPGTLSLLGLGAFGLLVARRR